MDRPSIDDLLHQVPSIYELTMIAAKRAIEIKRKDRTTPQPLQRALEEISKGEVMSQWKNRPGASGEQFELHLEVETVSVAVSDEHFDDEVVEAETDTAVAVEGVEEEDDDEVEAEAVEVEEAEVPEEDVEIEEIDEEIYDEDELSDKEEY